MQQQRMKPHDSCDKEEKAEWTRTTIAGSVNCWLLIANDMDDMKKDEEKRMEVEHQKLVSRMIRSAGGGPGLSHKNHQTNSVERRSADSKGGRRRCQAFGQM